MDRKEFLSTFGLGLAVVCTGGCLASCSKGKADGPGGGSTPPPPPPNRVNFTVNLSNEIVGIGDTVTKSGVIVARLAQGNAASSFTAVQVACTHQGTAINFDAGQGNFLCPNHGSRFTTSGAVINGPAATDLKRYTINISGTTMTVTE